MQLAGECESGEASMGRTTSRQRTLTGPEADSPGGLGGSVNGELDSTSITI